MINKNRLKTSSYLLNLLIAGLVIAGLLWLVTKLTIDGLYPMAGVLSAITVFIAMVYLRPKFTPWRWLAVGVTIAVLFTIYPIFYTFNISFSNMSSGHLMTKQQAIVRIEQLQFIPENSVKYGWTAFKADDGSFALWLVAKDGTTWFAKQGSAAEQLAAGQGGVGELDKDGIPTTIEGYQRLSRKESITQLTDLSNLEFGLAPTTYKIKSLKEANESAQLYRYDPAQDVVIDQQTGELFKPVEGTFTSESGAELIPGWSVTIGTKHYEYFTGTEGFRKPLSKILLWNISFTFFSVFISFAVGLVASIMFEGLPGKRIIRSLLIIPWPIPVLVSVLIWRNMLHPDMGFIAPMLEAIFGSSPDWFTNTFWTRFGIILVNVWLSYPYFYVITAGALRAIPEEIYSAAIVDGANPWQKFRYITFPLLMKILTPLIVASLTFNFNNFNVIYIFNYGLPAMADTIVPMGTSDILVSFVYRLAFVSSNVADFGLAGAITVLLFLLIAVMVILQIRVGNMFKEAD
jgi:ABC-type sugar transport system permease subunit